MEAYPEHFQESCIIKVKLSGDGAKFSKSSNFIILSFSLPVLKSKVLSGSGNGIILHTNSTYNVQASNVCVTINIGNHSIVVIKGAESYKSFKRVLDTINKLIMQVNISIKGKVY